MAGSSEFTAEQKRAFVAQAKKEGRAAASKAAGVSTTSISAWARALGVKLTPGAAPGKKRTAKKTRRSANAKGNGHRSARVVRGVEAPSGGLDTIRNQLLDALKSVEALRTAHRQVFG
jgi:hypothetical protein